MNLRALRATAAERLQPGDGYAGEVTSEEAWQILEAESDAALVDVRTNAEWAFVGLPDLSQLGKEPARISWQVFPSMAENANFVDDVAATGIADATPVMFLCRSGARSRLAAIACAAGGNTQSFNVIDGFEGPRDDRGHRGTRAGWKAAGLPWQQA
jgi:rhodanese-related sulfurtransferase